MSVKRQSSSTEGLQANHLKVKYFPLILSSSELKSDPEDLFCIAIQRLLEVPRIHGSRGR